MHVAHVVALLRICAPEGADTPLVEVGNPATSTIGRSRGDAAPRERSGEPEPSGPRLELEGLELDAEGSTSTSSEAARDREEDRFAKRSDIFSTLTERAEAILHRTTIGGYGEHEFVAGEGQVSKFRAHRYVVFVYSQIAERISTATEIEFEFGGSPLKKDGVLGFGEVLLEFSVVDFRIFDGLVFRAGILLVPVGAYNLRHDSPTQDLTDRPIAYTTIVPTTWFETGAGFHGTLDIGGAQRLTYELYLVNGLDARIFDGLGFRAARGSHFDDNNHDKAIVGRVAYSPSLGLEIGLSGYSGAYDLRGNRVTLGNADLTWRLGEIEVQAEGVLAAIDDGFVEGFSASSPANTRDAVPTEMAGFYVQTNAHFMLEPLLDLFPDWLKGSTFTGVLRYEGKDTDLHRRSAAGDERKLTFGLNFRPIEAFVLKTDYQLGARGRDEEESAPDLWKAAFWKRAERTFLTSVAFLF